jgi:hypothetical protein
MKTVRLILSATLLCFHAALTAAEPDPLPGLWVGTVSVDRVSEPQSGPVVPTTDSLAVVVTNDPPLRVTNSVGVVTLQEKSTNYLQFVRTNVSLTPTPVGSPATLRLLIHVDRNHQATLLKDVVLARAADAGGRLVLVTDPALYSGLAGGAGRRLTSTHFDFPEFHLPMGGIFSTDPGTSVSVTNRLSFDAPTNPFKHRYHPDHDNKDATFSKTQAEAYDITRIISLSFFAASAKGLRPDYGERYLEGIYSETVSGLVATNIVASGAVQLQRVSQVSSLNGAE